jgi:hypothetical protein
MARDSLRSRRIGEPVIGGDRSVAMAAGTAVAPYASLLARRGSQTLRRKQPVLRRRACIAYEESIQQE